MKRPLIGINCDYAHRPSGEKRLALNLCYIRAVEDAGGTPVLLPWQSRASLRSALEAVDGLLLTGGADLDPVLYGQKPHPAHDPVDPGREAFDLALAREADRRRLPTLAICLGCQLLNVVRGGTLVQDVPGHSSVRHGLRVEAGSLLASVLGRKRLESNSYHHQAVARPGRGLRVNARSPDGGVEGLEDPSRPFLLAVQWHPERIYRREPVQARLFKTLVKFAAKPLQ